MVCEQASSMAAVIFLTHPEEKGKRTMRDTCLMVTHGPYMADDDMNRIPTEQTTPETRDDLELTRQQFIQKLHTRTKLPLEWIKKLFTTQDILIPRVYRPTIKTGGQGCAYAQTGTA
jgi:hypothetical protein